MAIKIFADGADIKGMLEMYESKTVDGFTTNPSLMRAGGVTNYRDFAFEVLDKIRDLPVSFEVFADDLEGMEKEAREISTWADNVFTKIPALTTKGESTSELVRKLSAEGVKLNITTLFTEEQIKEFIDAVDPKTPAYISVFAGRIADTGVDPLPYINMAVDYAKDKPLCDILWASTREVLNLVQAEEAGCQIITVPNSILKKRKDMGKDLYEFSLDTVRGFAADIEKLGFSILPDEA